MSLMQPYPLHNNNYGTWNPLKIVKLRISDVFSATVKARLNAHIYVVVLCRSHVVILLSIGCRDGSPVQIVLLLVNKYLFSLSLFAVKNFHANHKYWWQISVTDMN